ncbi:MAG: hypothetical protein AWM53_00645 [Candidatus Dichloromethanomonas elyunquensis]|nr:MAG: hypothetical protein AWM53_00645 [Candidatus Dichloromethanomonas elyunquensis]
MSDNSNYFIPLSRELKGWQKIRIQVDVLSTGSKDRIVKLKEEFKVLPLSGDTSSYTVLEETKKLINEGSSVEFYMTVAGSQDPWSEGQLQEAAFQVEVKLDLSAMAQMVGSMVAGMIPGMGMLGGTIASGIPQEMEMLSGTFQVKAKKIECVISIEKTYWEPLKKNLCPAHASKEDLINLYKEGGQLEVTVNVEPQQKAKDKVLEFDASQEVWDTAAKLYWFGTVKDGKFEDDDHKVLLFDISPAPADAASNSGSPAGNPQPQAPSFPQGPPV